MNFISLGEITFKLFDFFKIKDKRFTSLDLKYLIYSHAKYGGPFAVTQDPEYRVPSENNIFVSKNICIFGNDGALIHAIPKEGLAKIVGLDFLEEEYLLVVMQDGSYMLIDPYKGTKKSYNFGSKFYAENIVEAKAIENSVVFYTSSKETFKFYYVSNIMIPNYQAFNHSEIKVKPVFFFPVSNRSSLSQKIECLVTNSVAGVHRLVEDESELLLFGGNSNNMDLPVIKEIKSIAISSASEIENQMIAFLTKSNTLYFISSNLSEILLTRKNILPEDEKASKRSIKLLWSGEDAVVIFQGKQFHIVTKDNLYTKAYTSPTKGLLPFQEIDV
jgi:hypothetical protein